MEWIHRYDFFLFDFDGLLVNTEEVHYLAYQRMLTGRGIDFQWDFNRYCQAAHYRAEALKEDIYREFPELEDQEPNWDVLYAEKKSHILSLLNEDAVHLMPGVLELLQNLDKAGIKQCVVTHSPTDLIDTVRNKHAILEKIPFWVTREFYSHPKPHSECYLKAIAMHGKKGDRIIGFEDTPRGIHALQGSPAKPVMICQADYPEIPRFIEEGVVRFKSFQDIPDDWDS